MILDLHRSVMQRNSSPLSTANQHVLILTEFITPKRCSGWSNALQNFLSEKEAVEVLRKGSWEFKLAPLILIKEESTMF